MRITRNKYFEEDKGSSDWADKMAEEPIFAERWRVRLWLVSYKTPWYWDYSSESEARQFYRLLELKREDIIEFTDDSQASYRINGWNVAAVL